jgi:Domain of unknown function (DUF4586)
MDQRQNEPYTDLVKLRRKWRAQSMEKNITSLPFKPSSVPPKPYHAINTSSGKGSHWGTIEQQWPTARKDLPPLRPVVEAKKQHESKNFLTAPPKHGSGYGYPNVTIGKSYEYQSDPYDRHAQLERVFDCYLRLNEPRSSREMSEEDHSCPHPAAKNTSIRLLVFQRVTEVFTS